MSTSLINRFFEEAPFTLKQRFAYACVDRVVRVYTVHALREAGLNTEVDKLARLPAIRDKGTARQAADAARAATATAYAAYAANTAYAAYAAYAANTADAAYVAARASTNAARASTNAARAAYFAYGQSDEHKQKEHSLQGAWIRKYWVGVDASTLSAIDAYIANGLLIED